MIVWIPAGANFYGRSRTYGPKYLLNEDVILVPINMRFGAFGFLSTFDEFAPGVIIFFQILIIRKEKY